MRHHEVLLQVYWYSPDLLLKQDQVRTSCDCHTTRLVRLALVKGGFKDIGHVQGHRAQKVLQIPSAVSKVGGNESCGAAAVADKVVCEVAPEVVGFNTGLDSLLFVVESFHVVVGLFQVCKLFLPEVFHSLLLLKLKVIICVSIAK